MIETGPYRVDCMTEDGKSQYRDLLRKRNTGILTSKCRIYPTNIDLLQKQGSRNMVHNQFQFSQVDQQRPVLTIRQTFDNPSFNPS